MFTLNFYKILKKNFNKKVKKNFDVILHNKNCLTQI